MGIKDKDGSLFWATGIDNSGLKNDADETKSIIKGMSDDVTKTSQSTTDAIDGIGKAAIESAKAQIVTQKDIIKQIEADIKNLESQANKAAPGNSKTALVQEVNSAKRALEEEKAILAGLEQQVDKVGASHVRLRTQMMNVKDELSQMEMAGKRGTVEYDLLQKKLGELNDQFKDTAAQATILADDQKGFQAVTQGVSGMAGAMSAATGIAALFGAENENLAKVQMRLQAVMAITIGLQQVAEMLNKDSYFSVVLLSKGKEMLAASEMKLAAATGMSTGAAKMFLIATGGIAIVGLVALVAAIIKVSDAHKEQTKAAVDAAKKEQEIQSEIAKGFGAEKARIDSLLVSIRSENVTREDKLKMIKQLKDQIPGYTAELSKEGVVIRENKKAIDDYMISLEKSLKLKAAEKELESLYTKMYKLEKLSKASDSTEKTNQFTAGLAKQGEANQTDDVVKQAKQGVSKAASTGIPEVQKEIDVIKNYISTNGLVSDVVLGKDKESTKALKEAYDATKDLQSLLLDINQKTSALLIEQQQDSLQKRLALIEEEKNQELQAITDKQIKIVEEYNKSNKDKKGFKALSTKPEDIQSSIQTIDPKLAQSLKAATVDITAAFGEKAKAETEKWNEEILSLAREFADTRIQIAYDYNEKIRKLEAEGQIQAASDARALRDKAISDETAAIVEESQLFKMVTDEKLNISKQATEALIDDIRARLVEEWAAGKLSVERMNELMAQVNEAQDKVQGDKSQNNPFAQLGSAISKRKTAKSDYDAALKDPSKTKDQLADLESKANSATQAMAGAAGAALMGTKDILGSVVGGLDQLGMLNDQQKKDAENVIGMVGGAADVAMGIASGNPMQIIQGSIDLIVNGFALFDKKSREANREIERQQDNIDRLKESYESLERSIDKAFSAAKGNLINQQVDNLQAQNEALQKQINAENSKKKKDGGAIAGYEDAIKENKKAIEDLKDGWIEAMTGTDVMSAIDTFANAYADAWTSGENAAKKSTDIVKSLLRTALVDYMKSKLQPEVEGLMKSIANAMQDGTISDSEQAAIDVLTNALDEKAAQYKEQLDPYLENSKQSGVTGELKSAMTEGTASQLVGLWNMTAMDIRWIREYMAGQSAKGLVNTEDVKNAISVLDELAAIRQNTKSTADNTNGLISSLDKLKDELKEIKNNTRNNNSRL